MTKNIRPHIMYGTAWKENKTEQLTLLALNAGFEAIDTANQRKHYHEEGVGKAIASFMEVTNIKRNELFIQTKFTYKEGQDHRLPFDAEAKPSTQVSQSIDSSLEHLQTDYIDSYILHGPSTRVGLSNRDWEVWNSLEDLVSQGLVKEIGISNVSPEQLRVLIEKVKIKPSFVQNRCFASRGWDKEVRELCSNSDIIYQGFSLLTANQEVLSHPKIEELSRVMNKTVPQLIYCFARQIGMIPLTGTTNRKHMDQDLESVNITLTEEKLNLIETILYT